MRLSALLSIKEVVPPLTINHSPNEDYKQRLLISISHSLAIYDPGQYHVHAAQTFDMLDAKISHSF